MHPSAPPASSQNTFRRIATVAAIGLCGALAVSGASSPKVKAFNKALGRGINLGNEMEAPSEGSWGPRLDSSDFSIIAARGFSSVRVPIRWDGNGDQFDYTYDRTSRAAPYTVDPRFFARVDSLVDWGRRSHQLLILNDHHHDSLFQNYEREVPRFLSIWKQIAERYKDLPTDSVAFEILNEPNSQVTSDRWNWLLDTTLKIIRASNPTRPVLIGTADWGGPSTLNDLILPQDSNLILTVHDYDPNSFVFQGASSMNPMPPKGVSWGSYWDILTATTLANRIFQFGTQHDIPVHMGEFGTTLVSDTVSRDRWLAAKSRLYENRGFSWAYWDFKEASMGLYSPTKKSWNANMVAALFSTDTTLLILGSPAKPDTNLMVNGQFERDTAWSLMLMDSGKGALRIDSGIASVTVVANPTQIGWAVQLCQVPVTFRRGWSYVFAFSAWSDSATTINTWVGHSEDPYEPTYAYGSGYALTRIPQKLYVNFQIPTKGEDDSLGAVCVDMGTRLTTIHVDSAQLLSYAPPSALAPRSMVGKSMRLKGRQLVSPTLPASRWLVDLRGAKICPLNWRPSAEGWVADLRSAPKNRILFPDHSGASIFLEN